MSSSALTSPPGRSDLGKKFEAAARQRNTAKEEALRASKEEEISRALHVIKTGMSQRFPQEEDILASENPLVAPQDARRGAGAESAKIIVEATTTPPGHDYSHIDSRNDETRRPPKSDPAIAEFRSQLAEQKAICEGLQRDVAQKDKEINALEAEVRSVKHTLVDVEPSKIAEWRAKFENAKSLLHNTEEEVEQLKTQLKEAKDKERALQRELDQAKDEADRRERSLRNRVDEVEDEARRLRERAEGNIVAPQNSINYYSITQQQLLQQPQDMNGRRDSGVDLYLFTKNS
ncbi:hypothetical protein SLS55_010320 [Diplodia seriata]|uniref:Uncharacterized protein n=1 Tax=Diplodia seriata TaxID=420778 RepID=A0ABR3C1B9_9PEZI